MFAALALTVLLVAAPALASVGFSNCSANFINGFIPGQPSGAVQICRDGAIAISYDVTMVDPAWSAYYVTVYEASHLITGRDDWFLDPDLKALGVKQAPINSEAFNTTWNRGHLAPNHIMSYSLDSKVSSFSMANVAPQDWKFNQQPWNQLEQKVVDFIVTNNTNLHIVTGLAYKSRAAAKRSADNIAIPDYYFKVVCDTVHGRSAGIYGANVENTTLKTFVSVAAVEAIFGGALFPATTCNTKVVDPTKWWKL